MQGSRFWSLVGELDTTPTKSLMPQLMILWATNKTRHNQINKYLKNSKFETDFE